MNNIYNLTLEDLEEYFLSIGEKKFKGSQVFDWLYRKKVDSFDDMTNLKKEIIDRLKTDFTINTIEITKVEKDVDVNKYLFKLNDSEKVEAVLMDHLYGNSLCISTEVGCNMGCKFCESGRLKKIRNLETHEMLEQVLLVEKECGKRISHIVVMGIGEPFDNYDNLIKFLTIINDAKGLAIGARHITVSTSGLVPKILEFADFPLQINLAISLHAPYNELRDKLMKVNKAYNIDLLIDAIKKYYSKTNRRVTIEYVMLKGVNDSEEDARKLAKLLKGLNVYVNLIPYNETNHIEFKATDKENVLKFGKVLQDNNITVTIRKRFGKDINAACGQLRSKEVES